MSFPDPARLPALHLEPHQARTRAPTDWENMLADGIEAAFSAGTWELEPLVRRLNADGLRAPDGSAWTVQRFEAEMERLGR